ncbi:MAG: EamA family transporter [Deltaproteobacteria bacterium]|nr:EamA family transporter [Deltaproteobacteria bacterium]
MPRWTTRDDPVLPEMVGPVTRPAAHILLFLGLVLVSTAGPFLVVANLDAYAVVFWRMALGAVVYLGWDFARGRLRVPSGYLRGITLGALLLAAHFCLWVKAFDLTDFSSNMLLLVMQPVIAVFLGMRLGEKPTRSTWASIGLALLGLAIITGGDISLGSRALLGDVLCVLADLAIALFYVVAQDARRDLPLSTFMGFTLAIGAVSVLPITWAAGSPMVGYSASSWAWLAALVLVTTVAGHGLFNLVSPHISFFTLNVVIVLEPPIGILIGALLHGATVTSVQVAGGVFLGVAVIVGLRPPKPS